MGLQRPCGDFRPTPPEWSRTFQGAIAPGACNPWSRTLGVLGDALWNVLDHFKAPGLLQPPSLQRHILDFPFFRPRSLLRPSGYSWVQCYLGGPGGREEDLKGTVKENSKGNSKEIVRNCKVTLKCPWEVVLTKGTLDEILK